MHNNTYEAILAYEPLSADLFFERVNELFPEIFTELHTCKDIEGVNLRKSVVLYIAHAYSRESPLVISGLADAKTKKAIAEVVGLPDYLSGPVMLLKDEGVKRCIVKYLEIQKEKRLASSAGKKDAVRLHDERINHG